MFVWAFAAVVGLTAAGVVGNGWTLATGEPPHPELLHELDARMPLKVLALVIYGPMAFVKGGLDFLDDNPLFALLVVAIGIGWSFLQGVFILTTFFGFT